METDNLGLKEATQQIEQEESGKAPFEVTL
jgi:hypothetical protein